MTKEELEKEAEEKFKINNKDKDREHYYDRMWFKTGYLAGAEPREKRIAELEKENAELNNFIMQSKKDGISPINALIIKNFVNQLAKAKEIIEKYMLYCKGELTHYKDIEEQAEQFIREIEK